MRSKQNDRHFADDSFKCIFLKEHLRISNEILLKYVQYGLADNMAVLVQVIWDNVGMFYSRLYASLGLNDLKGRWHRGLCFWRWFRPMLTIYLCQQSTLLNL